MDSTIVRPLAPGPRYAPGELPAVRMVGKTLTVVGLDSDRAPVFEDAAGRLYMHVIDPLSGEHTFIQRRG